MIYDIIFIIGITICVYTVYRMEQYEDGKKIIKFPSSIATRNSETVNNRKINSATNKIKKMIKKSSKEGDKSIDIDYNFFAFNSCCRFAERIAEALKDEGYDVKIERHIISVNMTVKWK